MEFIPSFHRESEPLPIPDCAEVCDDDQEYNLRRIWVGNIDRSLSEFIILKLLQPHGDLQKLDVMYHKEGQDKGKPKGYCFATYGTEEQAQKAIKSLHNYKLNGRKLLARIANSQRKSNGLSPSQHTRTVKPPKLTNQSKADKIAALEAKLAHMETRSQQVDKVQRKLIQSVKLTSNKDTTQSYKTQSKMKHKSDHRKPYKR